MCQQTTADIYSQFLRIAGAIAKHNAHFRARFPRTDPVYFTVEKAISGAFWDMPVQLHAFLDAVEKSCSWEQHTQFAKHLEQVVRDARRVAEKPRRNRKGEINWKRSLPLANYALTDEIEASAGVFFQSVYSRCQTEREMLSNHERVFWERCRRLRHALRKIKRDREDLYKILLCLQVRMPNELGRFVLHMLL